MKISNILFFSIAVSNLHAASLNLTKRYKTPNDKRIKSRYWQKYKSSSGLIDKASKGIFLTVGSPNFSHIDRSIEFSGHFSELPERTKYIFDKFVITNNSHVITPYKLPMIFETSCKNEDLIFDKYPEENANSNIIFNYKKYFQEEINTCHKTIVDRIDKKDVVLDKTYSLITGDKNKYFSESIEQTKDATGFYRLSKKSDQEYALNFTIFMRSKPGNSEKTGLSIQSAKLIYFIRMIGDAYFIYEGNYSEHVCEYIDYNSQTNEVQCEYIESALFNTVE